MSIFDKYPIGSKVLLENYDNLLVGQVVAHREGTWHSGGPWYGVVSEILCPRHVPHSGHALHYPPEEITAGELPDTGVVTCLNGSGPHPNITPIADIKRLCLSGHDTLFHWPWGWLILQVDPGDLSVGIHGGTLVVSSLGYGASEYPDTPLVIEINGIPWGGNEDLVRVGNWLWQAVPYQPRRSILDLKERS